MPSKAALAKKAHQEKMDTELAESVNLAPAVTVNAPEPANKPSLKDRFLHDTVKQPAPPAPTPKGSKVGEPKKLYLVQSALPTMLAAVFAMYVRDRLPEEYAPCAPSHAEAIAMFTPIFEEIARYMEVSKKVSETAINLANSLFAMLAYGCRSYCTYVEIKHDIAKGNSNGNRSAGNNNFQFTGSNGRVEAGATTAGDHLTGYRGDKAQVPGAGGFDPGGNGAGRISEPDGYSDGPFAGNGDGGVVVGGAEEVASLLARDRAGRVKLGLLPG